MAMFPDDTKGGIFGDAMKGVPLHLRWAIYVPTGILSGLLLGSVFSLWFLLVLWLNGMPSYIPEDVGAWDVIKHYLLSGVSAGVIGGLGAPIARGYLSTALLGILCAVPFYVLLAQQMGGPWHDNLELAVIMGGVVGAGFYHMWLRD